MKAMTIATLLLSLSSVSVFAAELPANQASDMHHSLKSSMTTMHDNMQKGMMSNDPDVAFAAGMLPHHIGAVEMAQVELKYGKDPELRQLAQNVIDSQNKEIKQMETWLTAHGQTFQSQKQAQK